MRLGVIPEGPLEWLALRLGLVPLPLVDTHLTFALARSVMAAADRGVLRALAAGPLTADEVAARCGTHPDATRQLLTALSGARYARFDGERYRLTRRARRWFPEGADSPLLAKLRFQRVEWELVGHYDRYLESGEPAAMHDLLGADDWRRYGRAMRDLARLSADEAARGAPLPRGARTLLDIGGAHGLYAAALCRRHPRLEATVLDLPAAVEANAGLLAGVPGGERVTHRAGDAFADDLGRERWDAVLTSQFAHHFGDAANRELARRVAAALRPGGAYLIQDFVRPTTPAELRRMGAGAVLDLYFGATSAAGTHPLAALRAWLADAGLEPQRPRWLRTLPGAAQVAGVKPAG